MQYRREVDGLRALAVVPVVLFHAGFHWFSGGFVGVDVFFVISGYLITSIILAEKKANTFTLVNFYERRARRILPALFAVMLFCLPLAWLWLLPEDLKAFSRSLVAVSVYASNILFWLTSGYFDSAAELKPLLHTWSLAVEEQYYLFFPLFLMVVWRWGQAWVVAILALVALASLSAAHWGATARPDATFYLLPTRGWELLIGSFVAFYLSSERRKLPGNAVAEAGGALGLALLVYAVVAFDQHTPFPSLYALVPTLGTALIILYATRQTLVGRLLGTRLLVGLGIISYSAYLWHQPLFAFARHRSLGEPGVALMGALVVATLLLAYLSWKYVETPFRDRRRIGRRQIFQYSTVASALAMAVGVAGVLGNGYPSRLGGEALAVLETAQDASHIIGSADGRVAIGDPLRVRGALIGDSHADSIAVALGESAAQRGFGLQVLTKAGCPPVRGLVRLDKPDDESNCDAHYAAVFDRIKNDKSIEFLVIAARFPLYLESERFDNREGGLETGVTKRVVYDGAQFSNGWRPLEQRRSFVAHRIVDEFRELLAAGKPVYLVYPIPEVGWHTPYAGVKETFKSKNSVSLSTSVAAFNDRKRSAVSVLDSIGQHENLVRIHPEEVFCNTYAPGRCAAIVQSRSFYRDSNHLSNTGARLLADRIVQRIAP